MIEFSPEHEWIALFESEPRVLDEGIPWCYNTLDFTTVRNDTEVFCRIAPGYREMTVRLTTNGRELARFELRHADSMRVRVEGPQEAIVVGFAPDRGLDDFVLQLKPQVGVIWGNRRQAT